MVKTDLKKQEIEKRIQDVKFEATADNQLVVTLREERAVLYLKNGDDSKVKALDKRIVQLIARVDGYPAILKELENQLSAVNQRIAQQDKDKLIDQQQEIADECQVLSKNFVALLGKANDVNQNLVAALLAETSLREKTDKQLLGENYCHGSVQSLSMLLEKSEQEFAGQHTIVFGPGIVQNATPIQL